jgi:ATP-dependent Clp protease ATP-binding subunit ClpC
MANGICDVCGIRPATVRAEVVSNGQRRTMELCDVDYRRLARQQGGSRSPLESLFSRHGSLFDDFFGSDVLGDGLFSGGDSETSRDGVSEEQGATSMPVRSGRGRTRARAGGTGVADRLSEHAEQILQSAARQAADLGRREVDTEHLLLALTESEVVRTILDQFNVSLDDLRNQILSEARHEKGGDEKSGEIGVSPRMKDALSRAFAVSGEFGHSYVGPEHLLIGLAEEGEGLAADVLRRYG